MRAALYTRNNDKGYRIIYPSGKVEYCHLTKRNEWHISCISRDNYRAAVKAMRYYDRVNGYKPAKFLGYL